MRGAGASPSPPRAAVGPDAGTRREASAPDHAQTSRSIDEVLRRARRRLSATSFGASTREASLLMAHLLGIGETEVLARSERRLETDLERAYESLVERRLRGEPIAYLTGRREFYGRWFTVDRRALIPRPETEHLVELALDLDLPENPRILDVGTGSGCIALTLCLERSDARVTGTDVSPAALALAAENRRRLGGEDRCRFVSADLTAALLTGALDLVVSNPPYIAPDQAAELSPEITRFEPRSALYSGGRDGTAVSDRLLAGLVSLRPGVPVLLEIGAGQLDTIGAVAEAHGFATVRAIDDYAGIPRVVQLERRI